MSEDVDSGDHIRLIRSNSSNSEPDLEAPGFKMSGITGRLKQLDRRMSGWRSSRRHHDGGLELFDRPPPADTLGDGAPPEWALLLIESLLGLATGLCVAAFNHGHNVTRFTLPIRSLAFNKSGTLLAADGDDEGIKLIATIDGSISRVLKGHKGSVTGLAIDPTSEYLASVDGIGTVMYWELSSGKPIHTLKGIAPDSGSDDSVLNIVSWSPDGEMLAVPGLVYTLRC